MGIIEPLLLFLQTIMSFSSENLSDPVLSFLEFGSQVSELDSPILPLPVGLQVQKKIKKTCNTKSADPLLKPSEKNFKRKRGKPVPSKKVQNAKSSSKISTSGKSVRSFSDSNTTVSESDRKSVLNAAGEESMAAQMLTFLTMRLSNETDFKLFSKADKDIDTFLGIGNSMLRM